MSKFFMQALLSLMVAAGAAVGFRPDVKAGLSKAYREVKAFTQEITQSALDQTSNVDAEADVSLQADVESDVDTNLDLDFDKVSDVAPEADVEIKSSVESDAQVDVESGNIDLGLDNELESDLDLGVSLGN